MAKFVAYDYAVPITTRVTSGAVSLDYVRKALAVVIDKTKTDSDTDYAIGEVTSIDEIQAITDDNAPIMAYNAGLHSMLMLSVPPSTPDATAFDIALPNNMKPSDSPQNAIAINPTPSNGGADGFTWESSDHTVATIDPATGAITAIKDGTTTITATITATNVTSAAELTVLDDSQSTAVIPATGTTLAPTKHFDWGEVASYIAAHQTDALTVLIGNNVGFKDNAELTATFNINGGVIAKTFTSDQSQRTVANELATTQCAYIDDNGAESMFYMFGKLLGATSWSSHQYEIYPETQTIPTVADVGEAESAFNDRLSFLITDDSLGNVLGFFAAGGKGILDRYVRAEISRRIQEAAFNYIQVNQPANVDSVRDELTLECKNVFIEYEDNGLIIAEESTLSIVNSGEEFTAAGNFSIVQPDPIWRVKVDLQG